MDDPKLEQARQQLESATSLDPDGTETEKSQDALEKVHAARRLLAQVRQEHLKDIRQIDLDRAVSFFDDHIRQHARPSESSSFDNLAKTAQGSIDRNDKDFEHHLAELNSKIFGILWRQDWFVIERFKNIISAPHRFTDKHQLAELIQTGEQAIRSDDIDKLRTVVGHLMMIQIGGGSIDRSFEAANIIRG